MINILVIFEKRAKIAFNQAVRAILAYFAKIIRSFNYQLHPILCDYLY